MIDFDEIKKIREMYKLNKNITEYLRKSSKRNSLDSILYSYDLQAGSYTNKVSKIKNVKKNYENLGKLVSAIILENKAKTVLEAGVGEGNTLSNVIKYSVSKNILFFGCDLSTSRLLYAQKMMKKRKNLKLFTGEISNIPLPDNSIDLVYTSHAIEPNHGREEIIINELFRICKKYLVLIEPSYELGTKSTKNHIIQHKYCRKLPTIVKKTKHKILKHELTNFNFKKNNQSAIIIAKKRQTRNSFNMPKFTSPISKKLVIKKKNFFYCKDDGYAFPIIHGIPCLIKDNGILVSKLESF